MKKRYGMILCLILISALTGCGSNDSGISSAPAADEAPVVREAPVADEAPVVREAPVVDEVPVVTSSESVDVDLSVMSSTMIYSEVYNMMTNPKDYIGKSVKMNGTCATYHDEQTGKDYYACIVKDATACCSQGIEFELEKPDYPKPDDEITVVGIFQTYVEGGNTYCVLKNAMLN